MRILDLSTARQAGVGCRVKVDVQHSSTNVSALIEGDAEDGNPLAEGGATCAAPPTSGHLELSSESEGICHEVSIEFALVRTGEGDARSMLTKAAQYHLTSRSEQFEVALGITGPSIRSSL